MKVELLLNSNSTKESLYPFSNNYMVKICVNKTLGGNNLVLQFFATYSTVWLPILGNYGFFANCKSLSSFTSLGSFKITPFNSTKSLVIRLFPPGFNFEFSIVVPCYLFLPNRQDYTLEDLVGYFICIWKDVCSHKTQLHPL